MKKVVRKYVIPHQENDFQPHLLRSAGLSALLILIVGIFFISQAHRISLEQVLGSSIKINNYLASVLPAVLTDLANSDRVSNQLASLTLNPMLEKAAKMKAEDMATKGYFSHNSPEGVNPWYWISQTGYVFSYAGENLAVNFNDSEAVNLAWMNSPSHRANILNGNFTEVGIATAKGIYKGKETIFVVQMFGKPALKSEISSANSVPISVNPLSLSAKNDTSVSRAEAVKGTEIAVVPITVSNQINDLANQTFAAVKNVSEDITPISTGTISNIKTKYYSSLPARFITSPTKTLAVMYLIIGILLLGILLAVLFVEHSRRVRHVLIIIALLILLGIIFYGYRAFVHSEIIVGF